MCIICGLRMGHVETGKALSDLSAHFASKLSRSGSQPSEAALPDIQSFTPQTSIYGITNAGWQLSLPLSENPGELFLETWRGPGNLSSEVALENATSDTTPANAATSEVLTPANSLSAFIQTNGDVDWIKINVAGGVPITLQMTGTGTSPLSTPAFNIVTASGSIVTTATSSGNSASVTFTPPADGSYFIAASGGSNTGAYQISYQDVVSASHIETSASISVGQEVKGVLEGSADTDLYKVELVAGKSYVFTAEGIGGAAMLIDPYLILSSQSGPSTYTSVATNDDTSESTSSVIIYTPTTSGTFFLGIRGSTSSGTPASWRSGSYVVTASENKDAYGEVAGTPTDALSAGTLNEGTTLTSAVDYISDKDWFKVTLTAGQTYDFSLFGTGSTPLIDPMLVLRSSTGTIIASDDDSGPGRNAFLSYTATTSGTFYISAQSWTEDDNTTYTGTYTLGMSQGFTAAPDAVSGDVRTTTVLGIGQTFDSALEVSGDRDWIAVDLVAGQGYSFTLTGSNGLSDPSLYIHNSSGVLIAQDTDGGEDGRASLRFEAETSGRFYISAASLGDAQHGNYSLSAVTAARPLLTEAVDWGSKLNVSGNVVKIYFAQAGEVFGGEVSLGWTDYEISQALAAASSYSPYINLTFERTTNVAEATFKLVTTTSNEFLGYFNPPGTEDAGVGVFAINGYGWTREAGMMSGLAPGGAAFLTLIHEFGHGLGLAHPHDTGGVSSVMTGVLYTEDYFGYGWQNQSVYTVMSYNDGWPGGPVPAATTFGYPSTPMAIDIALLQSKYGANTQTNTGDTTHYLEWYTLTNRFQAIWDVSGTDTLSAERVAFTGTSVTLDLRPASMLYNGPASGGAVSYISGFSNGLIVTAGTLIENAVGHRGADTIHGNDAANVIDGLGGSDELYGYAGDDRFIVDMTPINSTLFRVNSSVSGGEGQDTIVINIDRKSYDQVDHGGGHISFTKGDQTLHTYGVETFIFADGSTFSAATVVNRAPSVVTRSTTVNEGASLVLTTANLSFVDPDDVNVTFEWLSSNDFDPDSGEYRGHGYLLVDGVAATTFTLSQITSGKVTFVHDGSSDGPVNVTLRAFDGQRYSAAETFSISVAYGVSNTVEGSSGADRVTPGSGADIVLGFEGDDEIDGGSGNDYLVGGFGKDVILGGTGADVLIGEWGDDDLNSGDGNDHIFAGDGDDVLRGGSGADRLIGGAGNDLIYGGLGNDVAFGEDGDDVIYGDDGYAYLHGGDGTDKVFGGNKADYVIGGAGVDELHGGADNDQIYGNEGDDQMWGDDGDDFMAGGVGGDTINGGLGNDVVFGQEDGDRIYGNEGNDNLYGQGGADFLYGDVGNDLLLGGDNNDYLEGNAGNDSLYGEDGDDTGYGNDGDDMLSGGSGRDTLYGGIGNDTLYGDGDDDFLYGEDGNDTVVGGQGNDQIFGGAGDDTLIGQDSNDTINGGIGNDIIYGGYHEDTLNGDEGNDTLFGEQGVDLLDGGAGSDTLYGGDHNDTLRGNADADFLYGQAGDDALYGDAGNDYLSGGAGADTLYGGDGNDTLQGGSGPGAEMTIGAQDGDTFFGGAGADTFQVGSGKVRIKDFSAAEGDKISFGFIFGTTFSSAPLTDATNFFSGAGSAPKSAVATIYFDTTTSTLYYDSDGTGTAAPSVIAVLENVTSLGVSDIRFGTHY